MKKKLFAAVTAMFILCSLCACTPRETPETTAGSTTEPTETPTYPTLLSYEAYMKMTPAQQQFYYETFPDAQTYMQWFNAAALEYNQNYNNSDKTEGNVGQITQPTESGEIYYPENDPVTPEFKPQIPTQKPTADSQEGKAPELLTYEEYLKLDDTQKEAYYNTFPNHEAYMQWFNNATKEYNQSAGDPQETTPSDIDQGKIEPTNNSNVLDGYGTIGGRG